MQRICKQSNASANKRSDPRSLESVGEKVYRPRLGPVNREIPY